MPGEQEGVGGLPGEEGGVASGPTGPSGGEDKGGHDKGATAGTSAPGIGRDGRGGGAKAPIVVGMVGSFSGVVGGAFAPGRDSYAAWAKSINAKGGIKGHPIKLLIADDGGQASNDVAHAKRFVEKEKAIALVNVFPAAGGDDPLARYAEEKGVPIVGGSVIEPVWHSSPMMFPQVASADAQFYGRAKAMKDRGIAKFGAIYCTEGEVCKEHKDGVKAHAQRMGMQMVYEGAVSLAQPDFTAQCVEARNRGAQAIVTLVDGASNQRFAQSCDRQGYHPLLVIGSAPKPSSNMEGAVAGTAAFPWFLRSGSPALNEYGAAMRKYVANEPSTFSAHGWVSGKLLEKALANVSDRPTSEDVLEGLWRLRGERLGGLAGPLTFVKGKGARDAACTYTAVVKGGKWTAPAGAKPSSCKP